MTVKLNDPRTELHERAWEAIDSLIRTLGSTLNAREIAKRSLLTVMGQLLLQRAAFYVLDEEEDHLLLMECLGVRRQHLGPSRIPIEPDDRDRLDALDEILRIDADTWLPVKLGDRFQYAARISEGDATLGLLLLGGKLGREEFDDLDRRLLHTMGMVMGTTLQRSLSHQQMLEAKRRTEAIQSFQQQILDHVTHEFNTPLTVIKSSVEFIRDTEGEVQRESFEMHAESVQRLQDLVHSIVEAGSATFTEGNLRVQSPAQIIDLCLAPLVDSSPWHDALVVQNHRGGERHRVHVDLGGLRAALDALLANAWRFSPPLRRRLAVFTDLVDRDHWMSLDHRHRIEAFSHCEAEELSEKVTEILLTGAGRSSDPGSAPTHMVLEIIDAGIGVPPGERATIFEPFAQASNSPFRHVSGTGMGLMIARTRIDEMRGEIRLVSTESVGSLFAILLPLISVDAASEPRT